MYNKDLFNKIIPEHGSWRRTNTGFTVRLMYATSYYGLAKEKSLHSVASGVELFISDSELAAINPLFPTDLHVRISFNPLISKRDLAELLDIWACDTIIMQQPTEHRSYHPVAMLSVNAIDVEVDKVSIRGSGYAVVRQRLSETGQSVFMPLGGQSVVELSHEWMNEEYPGWEIRYAIANDLGLDPINIVRSLIQNENAFQKEVLPNDVSL